MNIEKIQRRGAVTKKVTKAEFFTTMVKMCPKCRGEQFIPVWLEDGRQIEKFCPMCFGSGISPKEACFKRAFVWAK